MCLYRVSLADGSQTIVKEKVSVSFIIVDMFFTQAFLLMPTLHRPIILGVDFLSKAKAQISFTGLPEQTHKPVRTERSFTINAHTEYIACARVVSMDDLCDTIGITDTFIYSDSSQVAVKRTLVRPDGDNFIRVALYNHSDEDISFLPGDVLALYSRADPNKFLPFSEAPKECVPHLSISEISPPLEEQTPVSPEWAVDSQPLSDGERLHSLSEAESKDFCQLLADFPEVFVGSNNKIGVTDRYEHKIELKPSYVPVNRLPYRAAPEKRRIIDQMIQQQVEEGILEECTEQGEWSSPIFLVEKPGSTPHNRRYRVVQDFRELNQQIKDMASPYPRQDDVLELVGSSEASVYSRMDAQSGFYQIPLRKQDRPLTAFTTHDKRYQYRVMPQGLKTSPRGFQNFMEAVIQKLKYKHTLCYIDDIVCYSPSIGQHTKDLRELFQALSDAKLKLKREKCTFFLSKMKFLGYLLDAEGLHPDPQKVEAIHLYKPPKNIKQVRSFVGMAQFYRRFVKDFSTIMRPIYALTNHNVDFVWSAACQRAFETVKKALICNAVLTHPDFSKEFTITTDASDYGLGACLAQEDKNSFLRPIAFASRCLNSAEQNYSATDRELLAVVFGLEQFKHYVEHQHFVLYTDHNALVSLVKKKVMTRRLARYASFLQTFDFELKYLKGRMNQVADALSRRPHSAPSSETPRCEDALEDRIPKQAVKFNPCLVICQYSENAEDYDVQPIIIRTPSSILRSTSHPVMADHTVNEPDIYGFPVPILKEKEETFIPNSESSACLIMCPDSATDYRPPQLQIKEATVAVTTRSQAKAENKATATGPERLVETDTPESVELDGQQEEHQIETPTVPDSGPSDKPVSVKKRRKPVKGAHLPKTQKQRAQKRRDRASHWVTIKAPKIAELVSNLFPEPMTPEQLRTAQQADDFIKNMTNYISSNVLPDDNSMARRILLCHDQFTIHEGLLYHLSSDIGDKQATCQLVVPPSMVSTIVNRHHDLPTAGHPGVHKTVWSIRKHFYWSTINKDVKDYITSCHKCLQSKIPRTPNKQPMTLRQPAPYPFSSIGMDTIGPIRPSGSGNRYINVVTDYYSRYVVAWPSESIDSATVIKGFVDNVANKFGYPRKLQTDNGTSYSSNLFQDFCKRVGIKLVFSTPYRPQSNGLVERFNQSIVTTLRSYVDKCQLDWDIYLSYVTFALNSSPSTTLGYPPNFLIFGRQLMSPSECGLPDLNSSLKPAYEHLAKIIQSQNLVAKQTAEQLKTHQEKMKARHDLTAKHHSLYPGMVCYVRNPFLLNKGTSKKLQPCFSGPFVITRLPSPNTVKLRHMDSSMELERSVHVERLKLANFSTQNPFSQRLIASAREESRRQQNRFLAENSTLLKKKPPAKKPKRHVISSKLNSLKCEILLP